MIMIICGSRDHSSSREKESQASNYTEESYNIFILMFGIKAKIGQNFLEKVSKNIKKWWWKKGHFPWFWNIRKLLNATIIVYNWNSKRKFKSKMILMCHNYLRRLILPTVKLMPALPRMATNNSALIGWKTLMTAPKNTIKNQLKVLQSLWTNALVFLKRRRN